MVNKRVRNAVLGCSLKNNRMISLHSKANHSVFQYSKSMSLSVMLKKAEVERFYEDLQDLLELAPPKKCPFHNRGLECKSRKLRDTWRNRQLGLGVQNEAGQRLTEFCQQNALVKANTLYQQHKR